MYVFLILFVINRQLLCSIDGCIFITIHVKHNKEIFIFKYKNSSLLVEIFLPSSKFESTDRKSVV